MEYIDLGLPSGTLWADRNVGAHSPYEYGTYLNFNDAQNYGTVPTVQQIRELVNCTTHTIHIVRHIEGMKFIGANNNSIFMPFAGRFSNTDGSFCNVDCSGYWWSCMSEIDYAYNFYLGYLHTIMWSDVSCRTCGYSVRLIKNK